MRFPLIIAGTVLVVVVGAVPAWANHPAANTGPTTLTLTGQTIQLEPSLFANGSATDDVTFRINGPTRQTIGVEIVDIVVDPSGSRSLIPAGSTPHTLQEIVTFGPVASLYVPDGTTQNFSVSVTSLTPVTDIRFGGVRVTITPDMNPLDGPALHTVSGVVLMVLVVPEEFDGVLPDAGGTTVFLSPLRVSPLGEENIFEKTLPDIPGVVNRGPVTIDGDLANESSNPFFLTTEWAISSGDELLLTTAREQTLIFGGQVAREKVDTVLDAPGSTIPVNVLPSFGFVDVHVKSEARLGQSLVDSTEQSTSFLVLRWKEPAALALVLTTVWFLMRATRRTTPEKYPPASDDSGDSVASERILGEKGSQSAPPPPGG